MKAKLLPVLSVITFFLSCAKGVENKESEQLPIKGTWKLISTTTIEKGDTTYSKPDTTQEMIKIINDTHFAFLKHDLNKGKDSSAAFVAGGGKYTLNENKYAEHLEYCNYREWENNKFDFKVTLKNDTLVQTGIEKVADIGVDREIIETYIRVNN